MKYVLAKTFGWDLDYIGSLPSRVTSILVECIKIEGEKMEAERRRINMKSRMRR